MVMEWTGSFTFVFCRLNLYLRDWDGILVLRARELLKDIKSDKDLVLRYIF